MRLIYSETDEVPSVDLPSSKSISNRLLIISALSRGRIKIDGLSKAEDTELLLEALSSSKEEINVGMAGTAFRFLTAYFATSEGSRILTGVERMKERPIGVLVEQLKQLGADIEYLEKQGYPPLKINGIPLNGGQLAIDSSISSQYISALLLIAPYLKDDLEVNLLGNIVSSPYIDLTICLMVKAGIKVQRKNNTIHISKGKYASNNHLNVEADWSSVAFFYQFTALSGKSIFINKLQADSIQGDVECWKIFKHFGVSTVFKEGGAELHKHSDFNKKIVELDLTKTPDLIPSVAITASQLVDKIIIHGTKTLYIKECNRVEALKTELLKMGSLLCEIDGNSFEISGKPLEKQNKSISFSSYNDHRIAMCLAPLAVKWKIELDDRTVVNKSFPSFWSELEKIGITT